MIPTTGGTGSPALDDVLVICENMHHLLREQDRDRRKDHRPRDAQRKERCPFTFWILFPIPAPQYWEMKDCVAPLLIRNRMIDQEEHCSPSPTAAYYRRLIQNWPIISVSTKESEDINRFCNTIGKCDRIMRPVEIFLRFECLVGEAVGRCTC
jgi:hypothetical protein